MRALIACLTLCIAVQCLGEDKPAPVKPDPNQPAKPDDKPVPGTSKDQPVMLDPVTVTAPAERAQIIEQGRAADLTKRATSASEGIIGAKQLEDRPISRPAEVLETVPGLIATQHSGEGKANQYFFRGFNLDHGTDFATWLDGMPVNMRSHGHGQGYTDLNFVIPELIDAVEYTKGTYKAREGDFSAAGAAHIGYAKKIDGFTAQTTVGTTDYERVLLMGGKNISASSNVIAALELDHNEGPFDLNEDVHKISGVLGYSHGDASNGYSITAMAYANQWNSPDQIPARAVRSGLIDRLGFIDPSDGGRSQRYSLSAEWHRADECSATQVSAYGVASSLRLWSNFTYFLDDPTDGDQFEQKDRRVMTGFNVEHTFFSTFCGRRVENTIGFQNRNDNIDLGLFHTQDRSVIGVTRADTVFESSLCPYFENSVQWLPKLRTVSGLRGDMFYFDTDSDNPLNSGTKWAGKASPKLSIIMGPWSETEFYLNGGYGLHSNDARGVTSRVDPVSGNPVQAAPALVGARGGEFGIRTTHIKGLNTSLSFFILDLDSELVFSGDAGTTEASRPSRRIGLEYANFYKPLDWLTIDLDYSLSNARFKDRDPVGEHIPGSLQSVLATGFSIDHCSGWFGGMRLRYFGPRSLIEDNSAKSASTSEVSARVGYNFNKHCKITLEGFNILNSKSHDIDYFYASRLPGEPAGGVSDYHYHPIEPIQARLTFTIKW